MCSELAGTDFTIRKKTSNENSKVQKVRNWINCGIPRNSERISQPRQCLFFYFISELRRDGLWACPQPDEAVSIICTVVNKLYLQLLGEVDVCELYYWLARVYSGASWRCSSFNLCLGSLTWLAYACGMHCQDDVAPGEFLLTNEYANFSGLGTLTHVCVWSIADRCIIKRHGSHAWYGCWTIKALVEAEVLWWLLWFVGA